MERIVRVGWDIGGAHVKAAAIDTAGNVVTVWQQPCPLWRGMEFLDQAVRTILAALPEPCRCHCVTMTGELVDLFASRNEGVRRIIAAMSALLPEVEVKIYAGRFGFLNIDSVGSEYYAAIASANWLASASYAADRLGNGLLVDIGSTTTDIILLAQGYAQPQGLTDYQRLVSGELVYTGIVRTAVMAVAQTAVFQGIEVGLMAEYFATMADVYRLTGELHEAHDQADTADGGDKTVNASACRLARMIGCEFDPAMSDAWRHLAENLRDQQLSRIRQICQKQMARAHSTTKLPLVGAGIGRFLVAQLAAELEYDYIDFNDLVPHAGAADAMTSADCAPAIAVALLAENS